MRDGDTGPLTGLMNEGLDACVRGACAALLPYRAAAAAMSE